MHEYIEKDVVINDIGELFTICYETLPNEYGHHFIVEKELQTHLDFVRNLPAADMVEVVRCKDCRYYYKDDDGYEMCDNSEGYDHISEDGYCAWAVRRADNGK